MKKILKQAFTLIELLVVIAIIGILSGLIIVSLGGMTQKATIAKAQVFSNSLRNSLLMNIAGEWKMDEGSGTAVNDTWTKINNGTLYNFTNTTAGYGDTHADGWMSSSNCISGPCLKFDGVDDYINCGNGASLNITGSAITLGAWVKIVSWTNSNNYGVIAENYQGNTGGYLLERENANNWLFFAIWRASGGFMTAIPTETLSENTWYYVIGTFDGTSLNYYVNGVLKGSSTTAATTISSSSNPFIIGGRTAGNRINASIDDVRVYNATMPTSQIKEQYYAGLNNLFKNGSIGVAEYKERLLNINNLAKK